MTADSFFDGDDKLAYPEAERVVRQYLQRSTAATCTTVAVLNSSDFPNSSHNRKRIYWALEEIGTELDDRRQGRVVFQLPDEAP